MIACPKCGAELHFDITTQRLTCSFCGISQSPDDNASPGLYADEEKYGSSDSRQMNVILYSCPQCGGSIYSTDESVNGFCSYCGSNVMLSSRMSKMRYPRFIAPFKIDKAACKQRYLNHIKNSFFTPKELKDPEYLDRFRGIYMTYWGYDVEVSGFISLDGEKTERNGLYLDTDKYKCRGWLTTEYKGVFYDASSSFEDHYSERLAPFDYNSLVAFNPSYLSGFYADMPDLADTVYEDNALFICKENAFRSVHLQKYFPSLHFDASQIDQFTKTLDARTRMPYTTFFPVWFLSYRKNDRVAYAVVNGQTGRIVSDMPVDKNKFILSGLLISVPIFILLCLLPSMPLNAMMLTGDIFSLSSVLMLYYMTKEVFIRKYRLYDKGYLSKHDRLNYKYILKMEADAQWQKKGNEGRLWIAIICAAICLPVLLKSLAGMKMLNALVLSGFMTVLLSIAAIWCISRVFHMAGKSRWILSGSLFLILLSSILGYYIGIKHAYSTFAYYTIFSCQMAGNLLAQHTVLSQYNILTTRPLKQLDRQGGNDDAWD
ncbi:MAG: hypothetical protein IJM34_11705 [Lachnospiraceae bacterium]|nr:hypothetical protein [Lachnospiraceae bacterium]